ncbi:jg25300 [Pararge aegeria aegeria]|uniref:Jg25300 protein n=1 Tax=Pararge aegeria aegeria TaxID=348720 RepID=A0A8S4RZA0_9NEOP|nr:jg25300 [Pararge aegeria aegeria]
MEAGRAFQILAVRIRNDDAKRLVRDAVYRPRRDADHYVASRFDGRKIKVVLKLFVTELVGGNATNMIIFAILLQCCVPI